MQEMAWYIPVLIFVGRLCDVSIGTVRTMMLVAGHRMLSSVLGFFEVVIWVLAVGGTLAYLTNPFALAAYAGGFSVGILIGMWIEGELALGYRMIRVVCPDKGLDLSHNLRQRGYRVTRVDGRGRSGPVEIAFLVVKRREVERLHRTIDEMTNEAFVTVERVERPSGGSGLDSRFARLPWYRMNVIRK